MFFIGSNDPFLWSPNTETPPVDPRGISTRGVFWLYEKSPDSTRGDEVDQTGSGYSEEKLSAVPTLLAE